MEDSSNEKVKHEKQRTNIMHILFGQYVYTSIFVIGSAKRGTSSKKWFREKAYLKN